VLQYEYKENTKDVIFRNYSLGGKIDSERKQSKRNNSTQTLRPQEAYKKIKSYKMINSSPIINSSPVINTSAIINSSADAEAIWLQEWFVPTERDVICGWARQHHRHGKPDDFWLCCSQNRKQ
jgi:hypothetical protein